MAAAWPWLPRSCGRPGCRTFFVAHASEAVTARSLLPEATIYVLNGLAPGSGPTLAAHALRPVLGSREELEEWAALGAEAGRPLAAALHIDTGMNRLGLTVPEALALAGDPIIPAAGIDLLMSHLVSAERPDEAINRRQCEDFDTVRRAFPGIPGSLANSSGCYLGAGIANDMLRPGYALFGGNPMPGRPNPMRPVVPPRSADRPDPRRGDGGQRRLQFPLDRSRSRDGSPPSPSAMPMGIRARRVVAAMPSSAGCPAPSSA